MLPDRTHRALLKLCQQHGIEYYYGAIKSKYTHDSSCVSIHPHAVVSISHSGQLPIIVSFAVQYNLPIIARGGGSNTGGAGITNGVVVDVSKLDTISLPQPIHELSEHCCAPPQATHIVAVGAGTTIYELNRFLQRHSLLFPIVPTSQHIAQIGGAIATNAGAPESLRYGTIQPWIAAVDFCDGRAIAHSYVDDMLCMTQQVKTAHSALSETADSLKAIIRRGATVALRAKIATYQRYKQVAGYNLPALFHSLYLPHIAVCNACITGSMGTLGIVSRALLYCIPMPKSQHTMLLEFDTLFSALKMLSKLRAIVNRFQQIVSCELLPISESEQPTQLLLEIWHHSAHADVHKIREAIWTAMHTVVNIGCFARTSRIGARFIQRRKTAVSFGGSHTSALPIINDITIPIRRLPRALPSLMEYLTNREVQFTVYGHILQGNMHFRPHIPFSTVGEKYAALRLARQFYQLVGRFGGMIGGEHGTGILRAPYLQQLWGRAGHATMWRILNYFNPQHTLDTTAMFNSVFPEQLPASVYGVSHLD